MSNWIFKDEDDSHIFTFPNGTLIGNYNFLVICSNLESFLKIHQNNSKVIGNIGFGFSGIGELLRLYNQDGKLIDSVRYSDQTPWPLEPDGNGPTLELINPNSDNNLSSNWASSDSLGTPGYQNSAQLNNNFLIVSSDTLTVGSDLSLQYLSIKTNDYWEIVKSDDWIFSEPDSGFGNSNIKLFIAENKDSISRSGDIIIKNSRISSKLHLIQNGKEVFNITVILDTLEAGRVIGTGKYFKNSFVNLIAISNEGWQFINWDEDGSIISSDTSYSFLATKNRQLSANFVNLITSIENKILPTEYSLSQNYPNPFNPTTTIRYSIPINEKRQTSNVKSENANVASDLPAGQASFSLRNITIKVYDVLGRLVTTLVNQKQLPSNSEVSFNASNLASGIYYYQLKAGKYVETKKMILLK